MVAAKIVKSIQTIDLFRYKDPIMGPRQIPEPNLLIKGRVEKLNDTDIVTFENDQIFVTTVVNGMESKILMGDHLLYFVDITRQKS